jgi:DNA-binding CsgD family transcriptional regulator
MFTEHQRAIIREWSRQPSIAAVAEALELSEHTVQTHLKRMRRKLGVNRTFDVYRYLNGEGSAS